MNTIRASFLFSSLALLLFPFVATAHVHVDKTSPAKGETVATAPEQVKLWFSGGIETEWSKIKVTDADGKRVDNGKISRIDSDPKSIQVGLNPLATGGYTVKWNVVAHDGHRIKGSITFNIK